MILAPEHCGCPLDDGGVSVAYSTACSGVFLFMALLDGYLKGRCDIATPCQKVYSEKILDFEYDFIIIGGGTAGSIVAGRLSENEKFNVLLIEAGGEEPVGARPPSFYRAYHFNEQVDWRYRTVPSNYCLDQKGKGCMWPSGKVLGGSSVLNGMMYHRGHPADYEDWLKAGAEGWSWEENIPYFAMSENNKQIGTLVNGRYHSNSGAMPVQQFNYQPEFLYDLIKAINESGFPIIADMNDPNTPEGFCIAQTFNDDSQRVTTARAYLRPKWQRKNLSVKMKALVTRILTKENHAYGVEYIDEDGQTSVVFASKEIILSAGALNTPQILMLSGIGPRETLKKFKIPVVANLPVGKNLRNHYGITLNFVVTKLQNLEVLNWSVLTDFLLEKIGAMTATGITQLTGILSSSLADKERNQPDLQFFFNGFYADCSKTGEINAPATDCPQSGRNISSNAVILLPRSVGYLTLKSTNPRDPPLFYPNYFSHPNDLFMIKDATRYLRRIFESDTMKNKLGVKLDTTYTRRCVGFGKTWSDGWIECMARIYTDPQNHHFGTAAIGLVIDPELKVYNISGLRVIDTASMPTQVTGNPQGPIMMVAERGAAFIKSDWST